MRALHPHTLHRSARVVAAVVAAACTLTIVWWAVGQMGGGDRVQHDIRANAAICAALLAASWLVPRRIARVCAVVVLGIGAMSLVEFAADVDFGVDQLLFADSRSDGRIRLTAAICLTLLAIARLLPTDRARGRLAVEWLSAAVLAVSGVAALGYVFHEAAPNPGASIAFLPPSGSCSLLALAVVSIVAVPDGFAVWVATGEDLGALLLRRVLPIALVAVPAMSVGVVLARRWGVLEQGAGAPITAVSVMAVVTAAVGYTATALRRTDGARTQARNALATVNVDLEQRVLERAAALQAERDTNAVLVDRERIAADMHDLVIQRLYAVGLDLQARAAADSQPSSALSGIDDAIADLRRSIFDLKNSPAVDTDLSAQLHALAETASAAFDQTPDVHVAGPVDDLPAMHAMHLLAVAREAVSNAVRHSGATRLSLQLTSDQTGVTLTVTDNGKGLPPDVESTSGLRNIRDRATQLDGFATWRSTRAGGTSLLWHVPHADLDVQMPVNTAQQLAAAVSSMAAEFPNGLRTDRLAVAGSALREIVGADAATGLLPMDDHLELAWVEGLATDRSVVGATYPYAGTLTGHVITTGRPVRLADVADAPGLASQDRVRPYGPVLTVPIQGADTIHGVVILLRARGAVPYTQREEDRAVLLATVAGVLLDNYQSARSHRMEWDFSALTASMPKPASTGA